MPAEDAFVGRCVLLADDLDGIEQFAEARLGELALLVEEIALGDEDQAVGAGERFEGLAHMRQRLHRMGEQVAPGAENFADRLAVDPSAGHLEGGLDHRQGEALDAVAVETEVAALGGEQPRRNVAGLAVLAEDRRETLLRHPVEALVLPERIVGIEADGGEPGRSGHRSCNLTSEQNDIVDDLVPVAGADRKMVGKQAP